ncbi:hypothetical protein KVR01_012108 [Diaporthe batatas]|uniref:uncharacterized protein n=1 Tax=Diaporthe batatas TaxID=748121 RepID=UPI001D03B159|nr:uncharacterized protein KVR01_012108 [Diaporthe batatas]KAG8158347.1 hypothetical protein KVR01_012108 [Diaporthe batatas]
MCVIVCYACQTCKQETGQRDFVRHTDGQRFAIPDPAMQVVSFCSAVETLKVIIQQPALQSLDFPCANPDCLGGNAKFNKDEFEDEEARIVGLLGATAEIAAEDGRPHNDVNQMLEDLGVPLSEMVDVPDAKLVKWTGLATDKLKEMAENGDDIKAVQKALANITGMSYPMGAIYSKVLELGFSRKCLPKTKKA